MQIFLVKETSVEVEVGGDGRGGKGRVSTTVNLSTAVQENFPLVITWTLLPSQISAEPIWRASIQFRINILFSGFCTQQIERYVIPLYHNLLSF